MLCWITSVGGNSFRGEGLLTVSEECHIEGKGTEMDKLEDEDFESEGISLSGAGFCTSLSKGQSWPQFDWVQGGWHNPSSQLICSVPNSPPPGTNHVPLASPEITGWGVRQLNRLGTPMQELQALSSQLMPEYHRDPLPSLTPPGELLSQ